MSGDDLRDAAQYGKTEIIRDILKQKGNPCSTDTLGLTALHYATWNGHVECVKYLLCNPYGVDHNGSRCSSLDLVSVKNYSPLHLVALDCPEWSAKEICHLLLLFGLDTQGLDCDGHTPIEICTLSNNELVLEAFNEYDELLQTQNQPIVPPFVHIPEKDEEMEKVLEDSDFEMGSPIASSPSAGRHRKKNITFNQVDENGDPILVGSLQRELDAIVEKYRFMHKAPRVMNLDKIEKTVKSKYRKHAFPLPPQLVEDRTTVALPDNMQIYEHNITPLIVEGFARLEGSQSYKMLDYIEGQANLNMERRDRLVKIGAATRTGMTKGVKELEASEDAKVVLEINRVPHDDPDRMALLAPKERTALDDPISPEVDAKTKLRETLHDRLVTKLPLSQYQNRLPWEDDMLISGDKEYLRATILKDFKQQLTKQG